MVCYNNEEEIVSVHICWYNKLAVRGINGGKCIPSKTFTWTHVLRVDIMEGDYSASTCDVADCYHLFVLLVMMV